MIHNSPARVGNFTSSNIAALMSNGKAAGTVGKPFLTYVKEKNMERRLGRPLTEEVVAKALTWGKLLEPLVFDLLGLEYQLTSQETDIHPTIPYWSGSKDGMKFDDGRTVFDIKNPLTLKSFCDLVDPLYNGLSGMDAMNCVRDNHSDGEKYYWQLVSNAILNDCRFAELIVHMPYQSQLSDIKMAASNQPPDQLSRHYWIAMALEDELPFLIEGGYYKNINIIRFEVPQVDKIALTERVLKAGEMLEGVTKDTIETIPQLKAATKKETKLPQLQKA